MVMKWKYEKIEKHIHVNVYTSGIYNGRLVFGEDEFLWIKAEMCGYIIFEEIKP